MTHKLLGIAAVAALALWGCHKEPKKAERTEPWLAQPTATQAPQRVRAKYEVTQGSRIFITIKAHRESAQLEVPVVKGQLELDLSDLAHSTGVLRVDLGTVLAHHEDPDLGQRYTTDIRNWLDLGIDKPEAERERLRWAEFTLESVQGTTRLEPSVARRVPLPAGGASASDSGASDSDAGAARRPDEARQLSLVAHGALTFHGYRTALDAPGSVTFIYPVATSGAEASTEPSAPSQKLKPAPREIIIELRPLTLSLATFAVTPRDSHGVAIATRAREIGAEIGRSAKVSARIVLAPKP